MISFLTLLYLSIYLRGCTFEKKNCLQPQNVKSSKRCVFLNIIKKFQLIPVTLMKNHHVVGWDNWLCTDWLCPFKIRL